MSWFDTLKMHCGGHRQKTDTEESKGIARQLRPDYPDLDKDGNKKEPIAEAAKDAKKQGIKHQIRRGQ
tara:strand:+ start:2877 stop:3080 length:204 start_codon:yes stop_codon:yes gene_type:complete